MNEMQPAGGEPDTDALEPERLNEERLNYIRLHDPRMSLEDKAALQWAVDRIGGLEKELAFVLSERDAAIDTWKSLQVKLDNVRSVSKYPPKSDR